MKRTLLSLIVLLTIVVAASAQKPFYVYLNDGSFRGFLTTQIEKMTVSRIDADGQEHADYVMQEFYTPDSLYRIPIAEIDSIGFTTPKTQFQPDAINVAESLAQYVISADTTHIYLQLSTPKHLIPTIGEKLGYPTVNALFPYGFSGRVQTVTTRTSDIEVSCEQIRLDEVFETFYLTLVSEKEDESQAKGASSRASLADGMFIKIPTIHLPFPKLEFGSEISKHTKKIDNLAVNFGTSASMEVDNTFDVSMFVVVNRTMGTYFQISSIGHHDLTISSSLSGGLSYGEDKKFAPLTAKEHLAYGVCIYVEPGWFYNAALSGSLQASTTYHYVSSMSFDHSSLGQEVLKPSFNVRPNGTDSKITASIDGSIALGLYCEAGFTFVDEAIDKAACHFEAGLELTGSCLLYSSDFEKTAQSTGLYQRLKTAEFTLSPYVAASLVFGIGKWEVKPLMYKITLPPIWKRNLVPTFANTKAEVKSSGTLSANITSEMSGNCLTDISVGYKLFDQDNIEVDSYWSPNKYSNKASRLEHRFDGLKQNSTYTVYPMVNLFGHDVLAVPDKEFKTEDKTPKVTAVKVTGCDEGSFYNEGRAYKYKFNVGTTVEIKDLKDVADWGYVYKDPNGNIKHISLKGHSSPYTDYSYAYYRNETRSTACLYGYVKYEGDNEYYYDEPKDWPLELSNITCPDNNHPHAIDLGLPSGTKWCCMNVGSTSPEGYGGYYAWGETQEKSVYNEVTYSYASGIDVDGDGWYDRNWSYQNIGSDIAGTSYDVAHVKMGGSWRMPTRDQQVELSNNCTREWTTQNGVNGILVTGKNGGHIFLPAAGCRSGSGLNDAGSHGYYWSGSLYESYSSYAYGLYFNSGNVSRYYYGRNYGRSVRPVCP